MSHHGSNKHLIEAAAVTCVKLCKASTYINIKDRTNVLFVLVQSVVQDLKVSGLTTVPFLRRGCTAVQDACFPDPLIPSKPQLARRFLQNLCLQR